MEEFSHPPPSPSHVSRPQRHHFIPRFILRNFKAEQQPPAGPTQSKAKAKSQRDFLVNKIDLSIKQTTQRPVSQENAVTDLYKDPAISGNPYHLEEKFARLEQQAALILREACETFNRSETLVLPRRRKDVLRKFLFLMKYRNLVFFQRFDHETIDEYDRHDKEDLALYMRKQGFSSPREVWFDNLRVFLDIELDADNKWIDYISDQAYPEDAELFKIHVRTQFITFCQPELPQDEFILTENGYGVFEGPISFGVDAAGNQLGPGIATEYHNFAPVSPRLMIISRSCLLASPIEEGAPEAAAEHGLWNEIHRSFHTCPEEATSILHDLPVKRCTNSYSKVIGGRNVMPPPRKLSSEDAFYFQCFKLSSAHVHLINEIFLEEAWKVSSIIYSSKTSLRTTIETYLADDQRDQFKIIRGPKDPRLFFIGALAALLKGFGGSAKPRVRFNIEQVSSFGQISRFPLVFNDSSQERSGESLEDPIDSNPRIEPGDQSQNGTANEELKSPEKAKLAPEAQADRDKNDDSVLILGITFIILMVGLLIHLILYLANWILQYIIILIRILVALAERGD